ncbi:hypothetical protein BV898_09992 [Hypsibius exemplaris]|uniref:Receptor ligand binding region domain-containing protein n=1 Tax=Hypsibius exemplaris TaxID=2072580 RepID=A0A1W0WL18_HYPEX|nr:hypothetical protein BV898_09992 [Hypsibius exemplaris]
MNAGQFFGLSHAQSGENDKPISVEVVSLAMAHAYSASSMPLTAPGFDLAVTDLRARPCCQKVEFRYLVTYLFNRSFQSCADILSEADFLLANYYYSRKVVADVTVFVTPGCAADALSNARLAAGWNELVILTSYSSPVLRNRAYYPTAVNTSPLNAEAFLAAISALLRQFRWQTVFIVADKAGQSGAVAISLRTILGSYLRGKPGTTTYDSLIDTSVDGNAQIADVLADIRKVARVVVLAGHTTFARKFMIIAHLTNMTSDYVYLFYTPFPYPTSQYGNLTHINGDDEDSIALEAFRSMLVVNYPDELPEDKAARLRYSPEFVRRSQRDYNYTYAKNDMPSPLVLAAYSTLEILNQVIEETVPGIEETVPGIEETVPGIEETVPGSSATLSNNKPGRRQRFQSGNLTPYFYNRTFNTTFGRHTIDEDGLLLLSFDIKQINVTTTLFQALYFRTRLRQNARNLKEFLDVSNIDWIGGRPPLDIPECGFSGMLGACAKTDSAMMAAVIGPVMIILAILVLTLAIWQRSQDRDMVNSEDWQLNGDLLVRPSYLWEETMSAFRAQQFILEQKTPPPLPLPKPHIHHHSPFVNP